MKAINPATNKLIKEYQEHSSDDVKQIIESVNNEQRSWKNTDFPHRSELMKKAADILRSDEDKYAKLITQEMGKPISESGAEIQKCAWVCDYYAENAVRFLDDEPITTDASKSFVAFEPLGVVLAVMPWNFPFWQVFRFAAPALMAGNAGLLKHASNVPGCALAIEEIFNKAGFPVNIFRTLMISSGLVEEVIVNDIIKAVTLTGSEPAGSSVASIAGRELKKTVLELGGSDPYIVLEDADIDTCVETSVKARMINTGQSCIAAKRFIVVRSRVQEFEEKQTELMNSMKLGDPMDESTQVGPLARMDLLDDLDAQVKQSIEAGARLLCGGERISGEGAFYKPTVLTDVTKGMAAYNEETFGPVSAIIPVEDEQEAINVANDSEFGLGGSLWTQDVEKGERLARQVESGAVFVNGMTKSDPRLPFGGVKKSGYGRELSQFGIREFVNIKSIWIA
ncbi:MAG: aldehyde dehydrogenase family protein [candidate division Zixibacteria bacterium]|nr:aldehyde dehydrogenase family protein [candidate division Zixibacteria bacterium]